PISGPAFPLRLGREARSRTTARRRALVLVRVISLPGRRYQVDLRGATFAASAGGPARRGGVAPAMGGGPQGKAPAARASLVPPPSLRPGSSVTALGGRRP